MASPLEPRAAADAVFAEVQEFWRRAYPASFGPPFVELRGGLHPLDSGAASGSAAAGVLCIGSAEQLTGNAYYCSEFDGIAYDTGVLVPVLLDHYGRDGLRASLAHEFGHAVAARIGVVTGKTVFVESQADCFAGAYLASVPDVDVVSSWAPLLDFADQVTAQPTDAGAHGLAVDRAQAVLLGFRDGPAACQGVADSIDLALGRFAVSGTRAGRYDSTAGVLAAAGLTAAEAAAVTVADRELAEPIGQFAVATAGVRQLAAGAGLGPAGIGCRVGVWVAGLYGSRPAQELGGQLSDADEALNFLRARPGTERGEVIAFLDGFAGRAC